MTSFRGFPSPLKIISSSAISIGEVISKATKKGFPSDKRINNFLVLKQIISHRTLLNFLRFFLVIFPWLNLRGKEQFQFPPDLMSQFTKEKTLWTNSHSRVVSGDRWGILTLRLVENLVTPNLCYIVHYFIWFWIKFSWFVSLQEMLFEFWVWNRLELIWFTCKCLHWSMHALIQ